MQTRLATIIIFALTVLLICGSCLLNLTVPRPANNEIEIWGRFFASIFGFSAAIGIGLTFITVPENWLEKYLHPYYQRSDIPYKVIAGVLNIIIGIIGILVIVFGN